MQISSVRSLQQSRVAKPARRAAVVVRAASVAAEVPDMNKRVTMNWLLFGAVTLPSAAMLVPYSYFFVPVSAGSGVGGQVARDALGNDVKQTTWLATHQTGDRSLVQGLKGDASYLIVNEAGKIEDYGLNAVCTHLGCVVPWNKAENKFICPCERRGGHGSQYNAQGKKVRGPAPLSLALAHVTVTDDVVSLTPWTETDFR
eukprot:scaffold14.g1177.t1